MQIQSHILDSLPVFEADERLKEVVGFFRESNYTHVAVKAEGLYLGVLAEHDLHTFDPKKKIRDYQAHFETFFCMKDHSWLDVLEIFTREETNLVPVLDEERQVLGYYDLMDILGELVETPFFNEPGGVLVISKGMKDHSFSEIVQIVESNNARLLGAFITDAREDSVQTTLKISSENLNEVIQTFRRYNYNILFGNTNDPFLEDLRQRSEYLDKYLNV